MNEPILMPDEPALNLPRVITWSIAALLVIHVIRAFLLSAEQDFDLVFLFSFIPARYDNLDIPELASGLGPDLWTPVTYGLLHGDFVHLGVNAVWLAAFGSALAWRFGAGRFLLFTLGATVAGAAAHYLAHPHEIIPVVGASGAISGHMAAVSRFMFQTGGPMQRLGRGSRERFSVPAVSLIGVLTDRRVLLFLTVWFGINLLAGFGTLVPNGDDAQIAWEAHVGGFLFGLIAFGLFDPVREEPVPEPYGDEDET